MPADQRHEDRDQRQRHTDRDGRSEIRAGDPHEHGDRNDRGEHQLRKVTREVGVERVEPAPGQGHQFAVAAASEPLRPQIDDVPQQLAAQLRLGGRGRPQRQRLSAVPDDRPGNEDAGQHDEADPERPDTCRSMGDHVSEQPGLRQHQPRHHQPARDGPAEKSARSTSLAHQSWIERPHAEPLVTGVTGALPPWPASPCPEPGPASTWPVTRLRKTQ